MEPREGEWLDPIVACVGRCALNLVLVDGVPASGKSTLARQLERRLITAGREVLLVENDWFIHPDIRDPWALARGLGLALSGRSVEAVESALLERFLDGLRLGRFMDGLGAAAPELEAGRRVELCLEGAWWNLALPRQWSPLRRELGPGAVVLIEGTLSRAVYHGRFPVHLSVLVDVPAETARARFLTRNRVAETRRNLAFSALAWVSPAFRIAAEMIGRDAHLYDFRVELGSFGAPRVFGRTVEHAKT